MRTAHCPENNSHDLTHVSLHLLINSAVGHLTGLISRNGVTIDNAVTADYMITLQQNKEAAVIYDMMAAMVANARNTTIRITAERFRDIMIVSAEDRNNFNGYALSFSLMPVQAEASMAGGVLSLRDVQKKVATVSFSFPDRQAGTAVRSIH
jgi:hypothetical protein